MRFQVYRMQLENYNYVVIQLLLEILSIFFLRNSSEVQISHFSFPGSVSCARNYLF